MRRFIAISNRLKYIGLLGMPMFISDWAVWRWFWLFWLFGFAEILCTFPVFIQSIHQVMLLPYIYIKHGQVLPDKDNYDSKVQYSLPFLGQWIVINGGVVKETSHSWDIYTQRYAYDFVLLNAENKSNENDATVLQNYYCYGKDILAPADGVVVEVKDHCKDSLTFGNGKTDSLIRDIRGNYIVIQHAEKEYSVLAHLKPNSIKVKVGQTVKRKECIALCGNSGNTSEPHLHFQIQNGKSFFASAGLPIRFVNIDAVALGNYAAIDPRPIPQNAYDAKEYISRGQCVNNN